MNEIPPDTSEIIQMAWDDETSFDMIERQTGLKEADIIKIMRGNMKASSFRMWRKRVSGRKAKHDQKLRKHTIVSTAEDTF